MIYFILGVFTILSGITWTEGEGGVASRLTYADIFGVCIVIYSLFLILINKNIILFPRVYKSYLPFLALMLISSIFSFKYEKAIFEYIVHVFIFVVSLSLINIAYYSKNIDLSKVFTSILYGSSIIAIVGLLHFFVFPNWFHGTEGGLSGTFRNTGQAGAYFGLFLAILLPAFLSAKLKATPLNIFLFLTLVLALIFTFKRAALLGFFSGLFFLMIVTSFSLDKHDKKISIYCASLFLLFMMIISFFLSWGLENIPGMENRVESKFNEDTVEDFKDGFFAENLRVMISAFWDKPILGVGFGNISGVYSEVYEIHSSYMSIIAAGGILGSFSYLYFMYTFFNDVKNKYINGSYKKYLYYFLPFFIGLIISWGYTYHLRKREFWILFMLISLVVLIGKKMSKKGEINE
ncbi:O-antigen ligase family protein [Acinetobacter johnsonii]|uniref:O-antigen ligase family protein n=1 Tax=Acinetobacter johnsonii TaxID=40214 RepID=UPI0007B404A3|nr:O-antigen ligase family protein [Acinetobacter johnsonii]